MWPIVHRTAVLSLKGFTDNRLPTFAAAMAFHMLFSLGPILIFSIAIAEPIVGRLLAEQAIVDAASEVLAPEHLEVVRKFAAESLFRGGGLAALLGFAVLVYSGTRVFVELDAGVDRIWQGHHARSYHPVMAGIRSRLLAVLLMLALGLLFLTVILTSIALSAYAGALRSFPLLGDWIGPAVSGVVRYGVLIFFFTLIYKWLPDARVRWRFALASGAVNALLFAAGNRALVLYFEVTQMGSAFGAAAGIAAVMVWVYWTSLTILIGAQIGRSLRDALEGRGLPRTAAAGDR